MSSDEQMPLEARIEIPELSKEVGNKFALLEEQFERAEVEQLRQSIPLFRPLYEQRTQAISHPEVSDTFWVRVFSNAPAEIDDFVSATDAGALGSLKNLLIERHEVDDKGHGEPRSFRLTLEFRTGEQQNPFFENEKLVKEFNWRKQSVKTAKGKTRTWEGLVSEPVRIAWKKDMDLTKGLLDAACDLADAEKKNKASARKDLPEFKTLVETIEKVEAEAEKEEEEDNEGDDDVPMGGLGPAGTSFFSFFGYRGRVVSAEESAQATKEDDEKFAKALKGEFENDDDDEDDEDDFDAGDLEDIEIFDDGDDLAIAIAEDLWPNALKYFVQSFEEPDDFDEDELEMLDNEEEDEEGDDEEASRPKKKTKM